jgi:hypothetical protein
MDREQYEAVIARDDVLDEEVLQGTRAALLEERQYELAAIEEVLGQEPIEQPPLELGMSKLLYYRVDLEPSKAKRILGVLKSAQSMYGPSAQFGNRTLGNLIGEWSGYCTVAKAQKPARRSRREPASASVLQPMRACA